MRYRRRLRPRGFTSLCGEALEPRTLFALTPQLVADLHLGLAGVQVHGPIVEVGGAAYFSGGYGASDFELWKTDGTAAGTALVKDIFPGSTGSNPTELINVNGTLYFSAKDGAFNEELWKSDGTAAGTVQVKNINASTNGSSSPRQLTNVAGTLFFVANDGTSGPELWKSDGTTAGTLLLKDIRSGSFGSTITELTEFGGKLFFAAADSFANYQLWTSDGTIAGTVKVTSVTGSFGLYPEYLTNVNGTLFFSGNSTGANTELWKSDGSAGGTVQVADISAGVFGSFPQQLANAGGTLVFTPWFVDGELWKSDGTSGGTSLVKDIYPGVPGLTKSTPTALTSLGNLVYFTANDGANGVEIWRTDGTPAGTFLLKDIEAGLGSSRPGSFVQFGGSVYFAATSTSGAGELWKTDGTILGTVRVKDQIPADEAGIRYLAAVGGKLFFAVNDGVNGLELWQSDGTAGATSKIIRDGTTTLSSGITEFVALGGAALFAALDGTNGSELWRTDGAAAGTARVADIMPGLASSWPDQLVKLNNLVLFAATDATGGRELWKTDGTAGGTARVLDINPGTDSSYPFHLVNVNGTVYFTAYTAANGQELWKTDGTAAGTQLVKDIKAGTPSSLARYLTNVGGTLYFTADDGGSSPNAILKSDGTAAGTVVVRRFPSSPYASAPTQLTNVAGTLFFVGNDGLNGPQVWKSDGTQAGTSIVRNILGGSSPSELTAVGPHLYFVRNDGSNGTEVWKSDGTSSGTVELKDIPATFFEANSQQLTNHQGTLYFAPRDTTTGVELWKSDGTATGTALIKDISPVSVSSSPKELASVRGTLLFSADTSASGRELWRSDGTSAGTFQIFDFTGNASGSNPQAMFSLGRTLLVTADDGPHGRELWSAYEPNAAPVATSKTATALEDITYTVSLADLGFSDPNNVIADLPLEIKVTNYVGASGSLQFDGSNISLNQVISAADIAAGKLLFRIGANLNGSGVGVLSFIIKDDGGTADGGADTASAASTLAFNVASVNDAPSGADGTITVLDHVAYTLTAADFGFTDPFDSPSNAMRGVRIAAAPAAGTLTQNGSTVSAGQTVLFSSGNLLYSAAVTAFDSQPGYATFTFQVKDAGGTADGGVDLDPTANTLTINLVGANSPPAGGNKTLTTAEDIGYTFSAGDFTFSDTGDAPPHNLNAVKITTLPAKGDLRLNNVAITAGQFILASDLANFVFVPLPNESGSNYASFTFQVQDDGGAAGGGINLDPTPDTITLNVTAVNDAPSGLSSTRSGVEDRDYTFNVSNFGFSDANDSPANLLLNVRITSLPAASKGTLLLDGTPISAGDPISASSLGSQKFTFRPAPNLNNATLPWPSFTFRVQDSGGTGGGGQNTDLVDQTLSISLAPVSDPPAGSDRTVTTSEDTFYTFSQADFGFNDSLNEPSPNGFKAVKISSLPGASAGLLRHNGTAVFVGQMIQVTDIDLARLVFIPTSNSNGNLLGAFTFQVQHNGGTANGGIDLDPTPNTLSISVASVNDPPSFTVGDTQADDTAYASGVLVPGFAKNISRGPANEAGQSFSPTPPYGFLVTNNNNSLFAGQPAIDAVTGDLTFKPAANVHGAATVTVRLKDDGGTANGGIDTSSAVTFVITINKPFARHNTQSPLDVTDGTFAGTDGFVAPGDALAIINFINEYVLAHPGTANIPAGAADGPPYYDTANSAGQYVGDNFISAGDALAVINWLNTHGSGAAGPQGEGESRAAEGFASDAQSSRITNDLLALLATDVALQTKRRRT